MSKVCNENKKKKDMKFTCSKCGAHSNKKGNLCKPSK